MRLLFVMDPLAGLQIHLDSTFACMLCAQRRGHEVLYCLVGDLRLEHGRPFATVRRAHLKPVQGDHFSLSEPVSADLKTMDAIFMRKDPPFNMEYIFATYILEAAEPEALVVNRAAGLRSHNEKLYSLHWPEFAPRSLVTSQVAEVRRFQEELESALVIKPLDGNGGEGIFIVQPGDPNLNVIMETSTRHGARPIIAQRYLPEARQGDKRILIINGQFEGAVLRVPSGVDPRGNLHVGARSVKSELTEREQALVTAMGPKLVADGHIFVGIDVIGEHLTEVNVTSPTGIHEINALDGREVEARIIVAVERSHWPLNHDAN